MEGGQGACTTWEREGRDKVRRVGREDEGKNNAFGLCRCWDKSSYSSKTQFRYVKQVGLHLGIVCPSLYMHTHDHTHTVIPTPTHSFPRIQAESWSYMHIIIHMKRYHKSAKMFFQIAVDCAFIDPSSSSLIWGVYSPFQCWDTFTRSSKSNDVFISPITVYVSATKL